MGAAIIYPELPTLSTQGDIRNVWIQDSRTASNVFVVMRCEGFRCGADYFDEFNNIIATNNSCLLQVKY